MLNIKFEKFKKTHKKKINQVLYYELKSNNSREVENLINNFLQDKNSFVFESVEKGVIKGRYTIFGKNPDKIWEFNNKNIYYLNKNKKKKLMVILLKSLIILLKILTSKLRKNCRHYVVY